MGFKCLTVSWWLMEARINLLFPDAVEERVLHTAAPNTFSSCSMQNCRGKAALFLQLFLVCLGIFSGAVFHLTAAQACECTTSIDYDLRPKH